MSRSGCARCGCATDRRRGRCTRCDPGRTYVNVGFWSTVPIEPGRADGDVNRRIEEAVAEHGGHKSLYSDAYYDEDEFCALYGGEAYDDAQEDGTTPTDAARPLREGGGSTMTSRRPRALARRLGAVTAGETSSSGSFAAAGAGALLGVRRQHRRRPDDAALGLDLQHPRGSPTSPPRPGELGLARAYVAGRPRASRAAIPATRTTLLQAASTTTCELRRPPPADALELVRALGLRTLLPPAPPPQEALPRWRRTLTACGTASRATPTAIQPPLRRLQPVLRAGARPVDDLHLRRLPDARRRRSRRPRSHKYDLVAASSGCSRGCGCSTSAAAGAAWSATPPSTTACRRSASRCRASRPSWAQQAIARDGLDRPRRGAPPRLPRRHRERLRRGQLDRADRAHRGAQLPGVLPLPASQAAPGRPAAQPLHHPADNNTGAAARRVHRPLRLPGRRAHRVGPIIVEAMQDAGLEVRHEENLREHYALTLRGWCANLVEHWDDGVAEAGCRTAQVWGLYMAGSRLGFETQRDPAAPGAGRQARRSRAATVGLPLRPWWTALSHQEFSIRRAPSSFCSSSSADLLGVAARCVCAVDRGRPPQSCSSSCRTQLPVTGRA